ncbi:hypothetical protein NDI49_32475 [Trichocoleus sp. ST-U3]
MADNGIAATYYSIESHPAIYPITDYPTTDKERSHLTKISNRTMLSLQAQSQQRQANLAQIQRFLRCDRSSKRCEIKKRFIQEYCKTYVLRRRYYG